MVNQILSKEDGRFNIVLIAQTKGNRILKIYNFLLNNDLLLTKDTIDMADKFILDLYTMEITEESVNNNDCHKLAEKFLFILNRSFKGENIEPRELFQYCEYAEILRIDDKVKKMLLWRNNKKQHFYQTAFVVDSKVVYDDDTELSYDAFKLLSDDKIIEFEFKKFN